jgi:hypothetical protein
MPLTLQQQAALQAQLTDVQTKIASGVSRASYDGKSADFRSLEELYKIRDDLQVQLGLKARVRRTAISYNGGF